MSASKVKTPKTAHAKDANESAKQINSSSGKKLVQTRLPFKLLTSLQKTTPTAADKSTTPSTSSAVELVVELEPEPRKRKLSYGSDSNNEKHDGELVKGELRRSNSKENLDLGVAALMPSKKAKNEDIIQLDDDDDADGDDDDDALGDDDDDEEEEEEEVKVADKPKAESKNIKTGRKSPGQKMAHIQIKLPLNNKRAKRRKANVALEPVKQSQVAKEPSDSSDDIESLQPQKRLKTDANKNIKSKGIMESTTNVDSAPILLDSSNSDAESQEVASSVQDTEMDVDKSSPEKDEELAMEQKSDVVEVSAGKPSTVLTAKQQKLMEQRRKAREEKERKLQEERRLKRLEKEQREQQKKSERELKEEERRKEREQKEEERRKEREQKEEERRKEREEKERKRQAENDEKRKRTEAKEELLRKKDEERRRKEQEKEEAELKKKRAAASFTKFFVPKRAKPSSSGINGSQDHDQNSCDSDPSFKNGSSSQTLAFRPFQVKDDMILAPVLRGTLANENREQLDTLFYHEDDDDDANESIGRVKRPSRAQLYLGELRQGRHKPQRGKRNARLERCAKDEEEDDDVQVIDDLATAGTPIVEERPKQLPWLRAKYLHFADNRRPPYYGTWRKRSQHISARRPLGQDKGIFDYEVDSDCEWEEEEPGESLSASEDEKERESEEESEEEYNEWFVPHGHLSDEELQNDGELEDGNTREAQKAKLQVLQQEFAQEMKKQTKKIKPRLLGPVWLDENGNKSQLCPQVFIQTIDMYACWQLHPLSLEPPPELEPEGEAQEEIKVKPSTLQLDEPMLQQLVRLIHGNSKSKVFLISEYLEFLKTQIGPQSQTLLPSKTLLREKFDELASWNPIELESATNDSKKSKKPKKRLCWVVNAGALHKFCLEDLTLQNEWNYLLPPKTATKPTDTSLREKTPPDTDMPDVQSDNNKSNAKREALTPTTTALTNSTSVADSNTKKRGTLLMSVPRDQQFHTPTKNALISQYLRKQSTENTNAKKPIAAAVAAEDADIVLLSD